MKVYSGIYSNTKPVEIDIYPSKVYVASDIQEVTRKAEGMEENCYLYTLTEYDKDEYLVKTQADFATLQEELRAAKILLGVE